MTHLNLLELGLSDRDAFAVVVMLGQTLLAPEP